MSMSKQTKFQDSSLFECDMSSEEFLTFWRIVVPLSSVSIILDCPRQLLDPNRSFKTLGTTDSVTHYIPEDLHHQQQHCKNIRFHMFLIQGYMATTLWVSDHNQTVQHTHLCLLLLSYVYIISELVMCLPQFNGLQLGSSKVAHSAVPVLAFYVTIGKCIIWHPHWNTGSSRKECTNFPNF
jgi:hypothetical protein